MARLDVYVSDEWAGRGNRSWLSSLGDESAWVSHDAALDALDEMRDELGASS